ncbi:MAG: amidohydrolase family protein [Bdellovibrionales bacterium]|jgi:predicted amidohydrolase YtcJ|nr:amidohydrolase family protein [Bdellovibrionales bacterium]MBT3525038.1 amidohydrolase family protein [Bdellovibrionales bacterium]
MVNKIINPFDSHVHWAATGMASIVLDLSSLSSVHDLKKLRISASHFRGNWLYGEGWNHNYWPNKPLPSALDLDQYHNSVPILFLGHDGHSAWLNTKAIQLLQLKSDMKGVHSLQNGDPSGIVTGPIVSKILDQLPSPSHDSLKDYLLNGVKTFNQAGFTHIRDLSCSEEQWSCALELEREGKLSLAVSQFIECGQLDQLDQVLNIATKGSHHHSNNLHFAGIKIYFDGALGSNGALLSMPYSNGKSSGTQHISTKELMQYIRRIEQFPHLSLAIHALGDQAVHQVVSTIHQLQMDGKKIPPIHIEHLQLIRLETAKLMQGLPITCHMQPIHYSSDLPWMKDTLPPELMQIIFSWAEIEKSGVPLYFGSDAPIEKSSLPASYQAYQLSIQNQIPAAKRDFFYYHSHPDLNWVPNCYTILDQKAESEELYVKEVWFDGKAVI